MIYIGNLPHFYCQTLGKTALKIKSKLKASQPLQKFISILWKHKETSSQTQTATNHFTC